MIKQVNTIAILYFLIVAFAPAAADTLNFRSGQNKTNIKVQVTEDGYYSVEEDGSMNFYSREEVVSFSEEKVDWKPQGSSDELERLQNEIRDLEAKVAGRNYSIDSKWSLVWRSAVLPGWGFYHTDRHAVGALYSALFFGSASAGISISRPKADLKKKEKNGYLLGNYSLLQGMRNQGSPSNTLAFSVIGWSSGEQARKDLIKTDERVQIAAASAATVYLYQIMHAYFFGRSIEKKKSASVPFGKSRMDFSVLPDFGTTLSPAASGTKFQAGYNFYF